MADVVKKTVIPEGYEGFEPPPAAPVQLTPEQVLARDAGAGFVSDLLKMSGSNFALTNDQARDAGASFIGDLLRAQAQANPPEPLPQPVLNSINPSSATIGGPDLTMNVNGSKFVDGSVIVFNNGDEPTTFESVSQLSTVIRPSTALVPGSYPVYVRNPDGQRTDMEKMFTFNEVIAEQQ
jgi:hypothetical protein